MQSLQKTQSVFTASLLAFILGHTAGCADKPANPLANSVSSEDLSSDAVPDGGSGTDFSLIDDDGDDLLLGTTAASGATSGSSASASKPATTTKPSTPTTLNAYKPGTTKSHGPVGQWRAVPNATQGGSQVYQYYKLNGGTYTASDGSYAYYSGQGTSKVFNRVKNSAVEGDKLVMGANATVFSGNLEKDATGKYYTQAQLFNGQGQPVQTSNGFPIYSYNTTGTPVMRAMVQNGNQKLLFPMLKQADGNYVATTNAKEPVIMGNGTPVSFEKLTDPRLSEGNLLQNLLGQMSYNKTSSAAVSNSVQPMVSGIDSIFQILTGQ